MDLMTIQQGIGGLVLENWALQAQVRQLQNALASGLPKAVPPPVSESGSEETLVGPPESPTPAPPSNGA